MKQNPKIFVGYSDITNLHSAFQMFGNLVTFHGPMVCSNMLKDFDALHPVSLFAALNMEEELEFRNPPGEEGFKAIRGGGRRAFWQAEIYPVLARACGTPSTSWTPGIRFCFWRMWRKALPPLDMYITQMGYAGMFGDTRCRNSPGRFYGLYQ